MQDNEFTDALAKHRATHGTPAPTPPVAGRGHSAPAMAHGGLCRDCGNITQQAGSCSVCTTCGNTSGCS